MLSRKKHTAQRISSATGSSSQPINKHSLRFCHLNAQSLLCHIDVFRLQILKSDYDVIAISESWLKPWILDAQVSLSGYQLYRRNRIRCGAGGVAIFVKNSLCTAFVSGFDINQGPTPEYLMLEIWKPGFQKILVTVLYRPPRIGNLDAFENDFTEHWIQYRYVAVLGEFNANWTDNLDYYTLRLKAFFTALNMSVIPLRATHHLQDSHKWIDIALISDNERIIASGQSDTPFLSPQDLIFFEFDYGAIQRANLAEFSSRRCWEQLSETDLLAALRMSDWTFLSDRSSIDEKV